MKLHLIAENELAPSGILINGLAENIGYEDAETDYIRHDNQFLSHLGLNG